MRNISFSMTTEAYRNGTKLKTRRLGWWYARPGDVYMGCEKCQGLKKGEHISRMHPMRVISAMPEPLINIVKYPVRETGVPEVVLEGFPDMTPEQFVDMFTKNNGCNELSFVQVISFEHLWDMPARAALII